MQLPFGIGISVKFKKISKWGVGNLVLIILLLIFDWVFKIFEGYDRFFDGSE